MSSHRPPPPGPRGLPFVGSAFELRRDPLRFLRKLADEFGDVAAFRLGRRTIYQFNHPDAVREILVNKSRCFRKTGLVLQARPILGNGLLTSEGDFHRRQRRMIQPEFGPRQVRRFAPIVTELTREMCSRWSDGEEIDLFEAMLEVTLKIIARALFRFEIAEEARRFEDALTVAIEYFHRLLNPSQGLADRLPTPRNLRFRRARRTLDEIVFRMIRERRDSDLAGQDVLSRLLAARDVHGDGAEMSDQQVRDEVITLLAAGHETIATALTWTFLLLSHNPEAERALHAEIDDVLGDREATADDVPRLDYTRRVLAESMRLFPPLWALSRRAAEDCEIHGTRVPAGTTVGVSQYVMHRDARHFREPERFDPSRWTPEAIKSRPKYSYFPFGGGPRLCIGEPLAWMEGVLALATIARHTTIRSLVDQPRIMPLITLRPAEVPAVVLERRAERSSRQPDRTQLPQP